MKAQLWICVLAIVLPVLSSASEWSSQAYFCSKGTQFQRKVEIEYFSSGNPVPCESRYYRDIEGFKIPHLLMRSVHQPGKCEEKQSAYLDKMKRWGVECKLIEAPKQLASSAIGPVISEPSVLEIPVPEIPTIRVFGASVSGSFGMGKLENTNQGLAPRTMDAFSVEFLGGLQTNRVLIGVDLDLRIHRQLSSLGSVGGTNLKGQSFLLGIGIGAPLYKKLFFQASAHFLGKYFLGATSDQSQDSSFGKPLGLKVKAQYLFETSPFSADLDLQYLRWSSISYGSFSLDTPSNQWLIGIGLTYHFNH